MARAAAIRAKKRAERTEINALILTLCTGSFITTRHLGELVDRSPRMLITQYLGALVTEGRLELRYPGNPRHPDQAYRTRATPSAP